MENLMNNIYIALKSFCLMFLSLCLIASCASRPSAIKASFVSDEVYMDYSCLQLSSELSEANESLQKFSKLQESKANTDAATVIFAVVPASSLTGDYEKEVSTWKGIVQAINSAQNKLKCK